MSQKDEVREYLERHGEITPLKAFSEFGIMRLAARINELRREMRIDTFTDSYVNKQGERVRFARYRLAR